jgi:hypothetical protein
LTRRQPIPTKNYILFVAAHANYGKFRNGSNRFLQKEQKVFARQKTLRRAADFGFIMSC